MSVWSALQIRLIEFLPRLGTAVLLLLAGVYLSRLVRHLVYQALERRQSASTASRLVADLAYWGILTLGVVMAIQQFVDVTAFLAGLGLVGFTVGFALQDVMKNFAAGVILLAQQPFRVGEMIQVGEFEGWVQAIDLRSTEIRTLDGRIVILPNAEVLNHAIVNYTRSLQRRIEVVAGVAYGSDLKRVRQAALEAIRSLPGFLEDPPPMVVFREFGDSAIQVSVLVWVDTAQVSLLAARDAAIEAIKRAFDAQGIIIPFPIRTVLLEGEALEASRQA